MLIFGNLSDPVLGQTLAYMLYYSQSCHDWQLILYWQEKGDFMVQTLSRLNGFLMSENTELASIENGEISQIIRPDLLPFHFLYAEDPSLGSWLQQRCLDTNRTNSRFLLRQLNSDKVNIEQLILAINAAVVTDSYWLKEAGSSTTYEDTRFHEDHLAKVALLGSSAGLRTPLRHRSAELTNLGTFEKCWHLEDGQWWLYKRGDPEHTFSELATEKIGRYLGLRTAHYEYVDREQISRIFDCYAPASISTIRTPDFTAGVWNFEPAADLGCHKNNAVKNYDILHQLSPTVAQEYKQMVLLDALVYNVDRHLYNFGILRDQATGQVISLAPVYDHNLALSTALMDRKHILANEPDTLLQDWRSLTDSQLHPINLPPINELTMQFLLEDVNIPSFPDDDKKKVIEVLSFRGKQIEEKVQQLNRFCTRQRQMDQEMER